MGGAKGTMSAITWLMISLVLGPRRNIADFTFSFTLGSFFSRARSMRLFLGLLPLIILVDMLRDGCWCLGRSGMLCVEWLSILRPQRSQGKERKEARMSTTNPFPACAGSDQQKQCFSFWAAKPVFACARPALFMFLHLLLDISH